MVLSSMLSSEASFTRRLPVYLILDCSESMVGEPLTLVNQGVVLLHANLSNDPRAVETAWLSVIAFAGRARQIASLAEITQFTPPVIGLGAGTSLGAALDLLGDCINREVRRGSSEFKGDYKPVVFIMTDGQPTDDWRPALKRFQRIEPTPNVVAVGCGIDVDVSILHDITSNVLLMENLNATSIKAFFQWVSASVRAASIQVTSGGTRGGMPAPPTGLTTASGRESASKVPGQLILMARCQNTRNAYYLMRYKIVDRTAGTYQAEGSYKVTSDYVADGATAIGQAIDAAKLLDAPACPYCKRAGWTLDADKETVVCHDTFALHTNRAQVMFVLDVTGSMGGEIKGVKENINAFVDYIHSEGLAVEVGLIAFRDLECKEPPEVLKFEGKCFTNNTVAFKRSVDTLTATGGGSNPGESSFDALVLACTQPFTNDSTHILVLITDEPPLLPDGPVQSVSDVINALNKAEISQVHVVVPEKLRTQYSFLIKSNDYFHALDSSGRGVGGFRNVLMDIGRAISVNSRIG